MRKGGGSDGEDGDGGSSAGSDGGVGSGGGVGGAGGGIAKKGGSSVNHQVTRPVRQEPPLRRRVRARLWYQPVPLSLNLS